MAGGALRLIGCWFNVTLASQMMDQHWTSIGYRGDLGRSFLRALLVTFSLRINTASSSHINCKQDVTTREVHFYRITARSGPLYPPLPWHGCVSIASRSCGDNRKVAVHQERSSLPERHGVCGCCCQCSGLYIRPDHRQTTARLLWPGQEKAISAILRLSHKCGCFCPWAQLHQSESKSTH